MYVYEARARAWPGALLGSRKRIGAQVIKLVARRLAGRGAWRTRVTRAASGALLLDCLWRFVCPAVHKSRAGISTQAWRVASLPFT